MISDSREIQNSLILSLFAIGYNVTVKKKSGLSVPISNLQSCLLKVGFAEASFSAIA